MTKPNDERSELARQMDKSRMLPSDNKAHPVPYSSDAKSSAVVIVVAVLLEILATLVVLLVTLR